MSFPGVSPRDTDDARMLCPRVVCMRACRHLFRQAEILPDKPGFYPTNQVITRRVAIYPDESGLRKARDVFRHPSPSRVDACESFRAIPGSTHDDCGANVLKCRWTDPSINRRLQDAWNASAWSHCLVILRLVRSAMRRHRGTFLGLETTNRLRLLNIGTQIDTCRDWLFEFVRSFKGEMPVPAGSHLTA